MGYGNLHYAAQELAEAAKLFTAVIASHPDYAPAYNNLAQVQFEEGKQVAAERNARKAIALGGNYLDIYQQTLQTIIADLP